MFFYFFKQKNNKIVEFYTPFMYFLNKKNKTE